MNPASRSLLTCSRINSWRSGACRRTHGQVMLDHLPRDPGHIGRLPGKHVHVSPEEGDKRAFLFAAQVAADTDNLGSIFAHLDLLRWNRGVGGVSGSG